MDTIAAIATASGQAGVSIVRISGEKSYDILRTCFCSASGNKILPGRFRYGHVLDADGQVMDEAMAVFMKAPNSYTREDVAEIQCHGGDINARRVLLRVIEAGAKMAGPGEFTRRAFENGRMDLSQAEAVMALVGSRSRAAARCAVRQMGGGVSKLVSEAEEKILGMLALIEAGDDFPEEVDEEASRDVLIRDVDEVIRLLSGACNEKRARMIQSGAVAALCGRPNTGKSSLMNALLECERAIVTDVPGTTRDTLTESLEIDGMRLILTDTAGQREAGDQVEKIGIERARKAEDEADLVLLVLDGSENLRSEDVQMLNRADERYLVVVNKCDKGAAFSCGDGIFGQTDKVFVSALTGEGMEALRQKIRMRLSVSASEEAVIVEERQINLCRRAVECLSQALRGLKEGFAADVACVDLKSALEALWSIIGKNVQENIIDQVFSRFCVGK